MTESLTDAVLGNQDGSGLETKHRVNDRHYHVHFCEIIPEEDECEGKINDLKREGRMKATIPETIPSQPVGIRLWLNMNFI